MMVFFIGFQTPNYGGFDSLMLVSGRHLGYNNDSVWCSSVELENVSFLFASYTRRFKKIHLSSKPWFTFEKCPASLLTGYCNRVMNCHLKIIITDSEIFCTSLTSDETWHSHLYSIVVVQRRYRVLGLVVFCLKTYILFLYKNPTILIDFHFN